MAAGTPLLDRVGSPVHFVEAGFLLVHQTFSPHSPEGAIYAKHKASTMMAAFCCGRLNGPGREDGNQYLDLFSLCFCDVDGLIGSGQPACCRRDIFAHANTAQIAFGNFQKALPSHPVSAARQNHLNIAR